MYTAFSKREQAERALLERNAYITGLLANTNLDDNKNTKTRLLESVDIDYQNSLRSIYNIDIEEEFSFDQEPLFKAMKLPDIASATESPVPDRTNQNLNQDIDQGE